MPKRTERSERVIVDGEKLKTKRLEKGFSQKEIAYRARVSVRTISNLERGGEYLYHPTGPLKRIATALGVSDVQSLLARTALPHLDGSETIAVLDDVSASPSSPPQFFIGSSYLELSKEILARDAEADQLLTTLNSEARIVSVVAPAGFGKTALLVRAIQRVLVGADKIKPGADLDALVASAGLKGIAILNAAESKPLTFRQFSEGLNRMLGRLGTPAAMAEEGFSVDKRRYAFFELLKLAGPLWIVVENAEDAFEQKVITPELRSLLVGWCTGLHEAKLILLSRFALHPAPACHDDLAGVNRALKDGLPPDSAIALFRRNLVAKFDGTEESLLREIAVNRLYRMPIAIEAFAGYLDYKQEDISTLDRDFLDDNKLLHLFHEDQEQKGNRFFFKIIEDQLAVMDPDSRLMLHVVMWADDIRVPHAGLLAIKEVFESGDGAMLTRLAKANLLIEVDGPPSDGRNFTMHALIREGVRGVVKDSPPPNLINVSKAMLKAGAECNRKRQWRPAITLFTLSERGLLKSGDSGSDLRAELANAMVLRGVACLRLMRFRDAEKDFDAAIPIYTQLVDKEGRTELEGDLALALRNWAAVMERMDETRISEVLRTYDAAIVRYLRLVEKDGHRKLEGDLAKTISYKAIAIAKRHPERWNEVVESFDDVIDRYARLVEKEGRADLEGDYALALSNRAAIILLKSKRLEDAVKDSNEAISRYTRLVEKDGHKELEAELADALRRRASLMTFMPGFQEQAFTDANDAISRFTRLVENDGYKEFEDSLAVSYVGLARVYTLTGDLLAALTTVRKAKSLQTNKATSTLAHSEKLESIVLRKMQAVFERAFHPHVGSSRVDLQACKLEYSIVSPK